MVWLKETNDIQHEIQGSKRGVEWAAKSYSLQAPPAHQDFDSDEHACSSSGPNMIDHTPSSYIWIRLCIFIFNNTIPVLVVLCIFLLTIPSAPDWLTHTVEALAIVETAFYILVYLPRKHLLQRPAVHPELLPRSERRRLFKRAHDSLLDAESYLSKWFSGAPLSDIKRENVKQFFCWAFLSKAHWGPEDEDELEEYADAMEQALDQKLDPGWGKAVPLRLTLDPIEMKHRPLLWYSVSFVLATVQVWLRNAGPKSR